MTNQEKSSLICGNLKKNMASLMEQGNFQEALEALVMESLLEIEEKEGKEAFFSPLSIGDVVYMPWSVGGFLKRPASFEVTSVQLLPKQRQEKDGAFSFTFTSLSNRIAVERKAVASDIGKRVFLSKEACEKAIEEKERESLASDSAKAEEEDLER